MRFALVLLAACAAAPTAREQTARSFRTTVTQDLAVDGVTTVATCGASGASYAEFLTAPSVTRDCFIRAFQACKPTQVTGSYQGMDSGPFLWSATVVAKAGAPCEIRLYTDDRNDSYGGSDIKRHRCTALEASCPVVWTEQHLLCRQSETASECNRLPPGTTWEHIR